MLQIKFKGNKYVFTGNSLSEEGAIARQDDYEKGRLGFCHLMSNGIILRHGQQVGHRDDIEIIGELDVKEDLPTMINGFLTHPSWNQNRENN